MTNDLSLAFSSAVRAEMGRRRMTQRELSERAGFRSHNYLATRLRDERSFTLDDVTAIAGALGCRWSALLQDGPSTAQSPPQAESGTG